MATPAINDIASTYATLCPPPLSFQKKPRRATFCRRILRRSVPSESSDQFVFGPLDDIIDVIKSVIWESPPDYSFASTVVDSEKLSTAPSMWTVTPLPLSRNPSDQPLTIRKNRNSRSSASESSMGDPTTGWRSGSQDEALRGGPVGSLPWPALDPSTSYNFTSALQLSDFTGSSELPTAQQALQDVVQGAETRPEATKRRTSRLRLFTNGFPRLRRMGTGDTGGSTTDATDPLSATADDALALHGQSDENPVEKEPSDEAVETYIRNNARNGAKLGSLIDRLAKRLPHLAKYEHESPDAQEADISRELPTTLRATVRVFSDKRVLTAEIEEIDIAIDIEGVLHNRKSLPDTTVDVIFVIDNGYYVTSSCLEKALDVVNGALYHLQRGDRLALYTTHCTHNEVTGNRPDLHYPLRPFGTDTDDIFRDLVTSIAQHGTQRWKPPRPNPSMADVVLSIARSLEGHDLKTGRTHMILLSPASYVLHDVSTYFPAMCIHRVNPAILPYRREPEPEDTVCQETCCKNVFSSNWIAQESVLNRIKRILQNARSEKPVGELTNLSIDVRARDGCELVQCQGSRDVSHLRLGQLHTFFARVRVTKAKTQAVDLESKNPVFNSSLNMKGLRQHVQNAVIRGATKIHLLDVQILYQDSVHTADCWNYKEVPLLLFREMGSLSMPSDTSMDVHKRRCFHLLNQGTPQSAKTAAYDLHSKAAEQDESARKLIKRMLNELDYHEATRAYEEKYRQRLPLCPGPVEIEGSTHEWLVDLWDRKKSKRKGVAVAQDDIADLIDGMNGLERLD
ncbi:hypothetical protein T440DRAFT_477076 [Plenodomus tracheiphilus IPT5]|uniref:VWFA domain-containing protein n=1 Tax=Plenodomus tracheiphilus IPT5 TaxID=1408161 RepID=A0A6A7BD19_9PLEO|nr:hypothetical protein T440DRAFT_477076 [Plenodomus tracheiphilus IPT5]